MDRAPLCHCPNLNNLPETQAVVETLTAIGRRNLLIHGAFLPGSWYFWRKKSALTDTACLCTIAVGPSRPTEPVLHCKESTCPVPHYWPDLDHLWNAHAHDTIILQEEGPTGGGCMTSVEAQHVGSLSHRYVVLLMVITKTKSMKDISDRTVNSRRR